MIAANGQLTPEHYISLREAAKLAHSKPNVLRKHRVAGWKSNRLAMKDRKGSWWVDPKVINTIKAIKPRPAKPAPDPASPESTVRSTPPELTMPVVSAEEMDALLIPPTAAHLEQLVAIAIRRVLRVPPIDWKLVSGLVRRGALHAREAEKGGTLKSKNSKNS